MLTSPARWRVTVLALVTLATTALAGAAPAWAAQGDDEICPIRNGIRDCSVEEEDPGGSGSSGGGDDEGSGGGGSSGCQHLGEPVPCDHPEYGWYVGEGCYRRYANPQPDLAPPANAAPGGAYYIETCPFAGGTGGDLADELIWLTPAEVPPTPEELARRVLARIGLRGPEIRVAPDPSGAGLVGLPVYLWTEVSPSTWGPVSDSDSDAGLSVTITAQAMEIEWDMGDGTVVYCDYPGTPYDPSYGGTPSRCGHVYQRPSQDQPGGRYQITATTAWWVEYESSTGVADGFPTWTEAQTDLTIHELQVVTS